MLPNGDVIMVIYTSYREYEPGVSLIAARLRHGMWLAGVNVRRWVKSSLKLD